MILQCCPFLVLLQESRKACSSLARFSIDNDSLLAAGHAVSSNPSKEGDCTRYSPQIVLVSF
jgi:hypothetical protein